MEDLIIYGVGTLAVRGARHAFFGPSREARLAAQVHQLSTQVAEQARMIQQLQDQSVGPDTQHTGRASLQEPAPQPASSALPQDSRANALVPRNSGGRSAKRRRAAEQEASHEAKRKRGATTEMPSPAREEAAHISQSHSPTPSHSSPAEDSLHTSTEGTEESSSDGSSSSESGDEPVRPPQCPRKADLSCPEPSSPEPVDDSHSVSDDELPNGSYHPQEPSSSGSEALRSDPEASSSGLELEENPSPEASSDSQSMSKSSTEPSSRSESEDSRPAASPIQSTLTASSTEASDRGSQDSHSRACNMDAPPCDPSEAASGSQERSAGLPAPSHQISSLPEPHEDSPAMATGATGENVHAVPEPSEPARSAGSGHDVPAGEDTQRAGSLERAFSVDCAEEAVGPEGTIAVREEPSEIASHSTDAAEHSESETVPAHEQPSSPSQHGGAEAQQAAAFEKHSHESMSESAVQPEPKQTRSIFQRCTAALTGLLFGSPSTACSRIAQPVANPARAPMAPAPAEELLRPLQAGVSVATQADSMTLEAESGGTAGTATEGNSDAQAVQAVTAAASEAAHAARPIATGVFATGECSMDDTFLTELDRLFQDDERLRTPVHPRPATLEEDTHTASPTQERDQAPVESDTPVHTNRASSEQLVAYDHSTSSTDREASQRGRPDSPASQRCLSASPAPEPSGIWRRSLSPLPAQHAHAGFHAEARAGRDMDLTPDRSPSPVRRAFSASASPGSDGMPGGGCGSLSSRSPSPRRASPGSDGMPGVGYGSLSSRSPSPRRASRSPSRRSWDGAGPGYSALGGLSCSPGRYQDGSPLRSPSGPRYSPASPRYSPASPRYRPPSPRYSTASPRYSPPSPRYSPPSPAYHSPGAVYRSHSPTYSPPCQRYSPRSAVYSPPSLLLRQPSNELFGRQRYMPISPQRGSYRLGYPGTVGDLPVYANSPDSSPARPVRPERLYRRSLSPRQRPRSLRIQAGRLSEGVHSGSRSPRQRSPSPEMPVRRSAVDAYLSSRSLSSRQRSISSQALSGDARVAMHSASRSPSPRHSAERRGSSSRSPSPSRTPDTPESRVERGDTGSPPRGRAQHRSHLNTSRLSSSPNGRGHACFSDCSLCREDTPRPLLGNYSDMGRREEAPGPFEDNITAMECMDSSRRPFCDSLAGLGDLPRPLEDVLARMHHIGETPRPDCDIFDGSGMDIWEKASWAPWKWLEGIIERSHTPAAQQGPSAEFWRIYRRGQPAPEGRGRPHLEHHAAFAGAQPFGSHQPDSDSPHSDLGAQERPRGRARSRTCSSPRLDDSKWRSLFEPTSSAPAASRSGDQRYGSSSALHSPGLPRRQPAAIRSRSRSRSRSPVFHSNRSGSSGRSPTAAPSNARSHSHGSGHTRSAGRSVQSGRQQAERSPSHGPCEEEQNASDHTHSHGRRHSGRAHGRCGRRRRHLRDLLRPRGFLGAWRPLRRRRRSHSHSADAIAAAVASGPARTLDLSLPEAGEEARLPEGIAQAYQANARLFDESPQLRAPPGRARGVLLPSLSPLSASQAHLSDEDTARSPGQGARDEERASMSQRTSLPMRSHRLHSYRGYAMAPKSLKRLYSLEHIPDTYCHDSGTAPEAHSQERSMSPGGSVVDLTMSE